MTEVQSAVLCTICSGVEAFLADLTSNLTNQVVHMTEEKKKAIHNVEWIDSHPLSTN